ncbi:diacylglycerol kinase [Pseudoroseomonas rhizosphaerae]|uniref:Diacylglycerol kinase n=1 Tax=Teichococcus rhizosphaerae TaxID=1335062 RepID=A0A2C7ACY2_9PROT|nr:diacylglycerol kinase family protein [Pseudoroseomonas rhizosphaerae]PHK96280.1 diacylglycerol kinase [Pseudoroseomonas rhizosphaerae]
MRVKVIINAGGGSVRGEDLSLRIAAAFARHGVCASIAQVGGGEVLETARAALEEPWDAIVAGGGDGTIGTVAGLLAGSGTPLGVLPLGTLNHFARDLGIPAEPEAAAAIIAAGHLRRVDVAEVNGRVFINNSSVGLYADMVAERDRHRRRRGWRKGPAMLLASARIFLRFARRRLLVRSGGRQERLRTPLVFIGNNTYKTSLPHAGTRAALDEGTLCLCVTRHRSRLGLLRLGLRAALGRLRAERDFEMRCVTEAEIRSRSPVLRVSLDGEVATMATPLRYSIRPGALRVLAPEAVSAAADRPPPEGPPSPG